MELIHKLLQLGPVRLAASSAVLDCP